MADESPEEFPASLMPPGFFEAIQADLIARQYGRTRGTLLAAAFSVKPYPKGWAPVVPGHDDATTYGREHPGSRTRDG